MKPNATTVYELVNEPELTHTHKVEGKMWFIGLIICIINAILILFADEIFILNLLFVVRDPFDAEPSVFEIVERYLLWTITTVTAGAMFVIGIMA